MFVCFCCTAAGREQLVIVPHPLLSPAHCYTSVAAERTAALQLAAAGTLAETTVTIGIGLKR